MIGPISDLLPEELNALGAISVHLRANGWQPARMHICGCNPGLPGEDAALCGIHAGQRAVEHYHAVTPPMTAPSPAGLSPLLDQLDEARAKGTPGPWENPYPFTKLIDAPGSTDNMAIVQADRAEDAALIVAVVNALPQLTAALRAALTIEGFASDSCDFSQGYHAALRHVAETVTAALTPGADTAGATA